ncbi:MULTISPECIES: cytochrome b [unclassified Pseudoalteromonas]|uniref:cytochrome b n=1 Tax=unclassified Pseudoalteromonas TaxID=194690 RepID=UPI001EF3FEF5|nr:cytochrome b [Pseudoalteromonas sp. Of11M-6]MCG7552187.1 cytochrome b [Pseudoalteromonas sp. Of11M-6]
MFKNTSQNYGLLAILFHWLSALVVFGMFGLGLYMVELSYYDPFYRDGLHIHKSIGILLAALIVLRLIWKVANPSVKPESEATPMDKLQNTIAHVVHVVLYLGLFGLFVTGYLISTSDGRAIEVFNWFSVPGIGELFDEQSDIAGTVHLYIAWGLIGLVALHIVGALKHHFINKDRTLVRMLKVPNATKVED